VIKSKNNVKWQNRLSIRTIGAHRLYRW